MTLKNRLKQNPFLYNLNALIRGTLQYLEANIYKFIYILLFQKRYNSFLKEDTLEGHLAKRIKSSNIEVAIKKKGELNIFLIYRITNWEEVLPFSLKPFGKVYEFEWGSLGFNENDSDWLESKQEMNNLIIEKYKQISKTEKIDIVIGYLSGYTINPELLDFFSSRGSLIINFCLDDKLKFPGKKVKGIFSSPAALASKVHLNLTSSKESLIKYFAHGGFAMFWPEAAHPEIHKPYKTDFKYDISFVGANYGWRPKFIEKLKKKGLKIICYGNNWPNGPLTNKKMIELYSESRINLGFSGIGHSKKLMCLKGRDFEVTMSGGLYLCQHNPELKEVYNIGEEIVTYKDLDDCFQKIKYLLMNPEHAAQIRHAGHERALKDHTYEERWKDVFCKLGVMK